MFDILPLFRNLEPALSKTTARQLRRIVAAMLAITGRVTQLGLSRWSGKGGSYRTIHRFFHTQIDWLKVQWMAFIEPSCNENKRFIMVGDETVVGKAGKTSYGVDRFFSSIFKRPIPGLAFFSVALVDVDAKRATSLSTEQVIRTEQEKKEAKERAATRKRGGAASGPKKPRGRPKGSKNKNKADMPLSAELKRILVQCRTVMATIGGKLKVSHLALDGHFGNSGACSMVRQLGMHIISKMPHNSELLLRPTPEAKAAHPRLKYGVRLDYDHLPTELRVSSTTDTEAGYCEEVYQATCLHRKFPDLINVVILVRIQLETGRRGHVVLFSSDLTLDAQTLYTYYSLRFQIEFTFRDAKQYFGLEDFMGVKEVSIANAVGLSFFMVNLSRFVLEPLRAFYPEAGVNDLKTVYRARHYVSEVLKYVSENAGAISCSELTERVCRAGMIHRRQNGADGRKLAA